jgi:carbon-monoxide dehydrogenase medium subunit
MRPNAVHPQTRYHRPESLDQACGLLRELGSDASVLAGGTDVLVDLKRGSKRPGHLVSLSDLHDLKRIVILGDRLGIGALVTPAALEASREVRSTRPELLDAVRVFGSPQVRYRATVGGNLCTAASCGDLAPVLMVLGARVTLQGPDGRRDLSLEEFFQDHRKTRLRAGEILVEVSVPVQAPGEGAGYEAFGLRAANFITVAGVAAFIQLQEGVCRAARVALGAVAPTPLPVPAAQEWLLGRRLDEECIRGAARAARDAAAPISDIRGSSQHRSELVEVLCRRVLEKARDRAVGISNGPTAPGAGERAGGGAGGGHREDAP